jgi:hypothetical protein
MLICYFVRDSIRMATFKERLQNMGYHFLLTLSLTELVTYPDDYNDYYEEHSLVRELIRVLKIDFPIKQIHERYFNDPVNTGDVLLFKSNEGSNNFIIIDTYKDPFDQLDLVSFGAQVNSNDIVETREIFRRIYDKCRVPISYREGQGVLNEKSTPSNYPMGISIHKYKYAQQLKIYWE